MTPDPVFDKLGRFTPASDGIDPSEVLFRAGRASARTPRIWKLAVAGLLVANAATLAALGLRTPGAPTAPRPEVLPVPIVVPVTVPSPEFGPTATTYPPRSPESMGVWMGLTDPDALPPPPAIADMLPPDRPLTALSGRRGEFD